MYGLAASVRYIAGGLPGGALARAILLGIALTLAMACGSQDAPSEQADGSQAPSDPAPDVSLALYGTDTRADGETLRISDLEGKPIVMNFWFPSCPPCVAEMPDLERVYQKHKADGVEFIGVQLVGLDTVEDGKQFVSDMGITYPVGADEDGGIVQAYGITGFPTTVFIDRNQGIARKWSGVLNEEKLEELVAEILN